MPKRAKRGLIAVENKITARQWFEHCAEMPRDEHLKPKETGRIEFKNEGDRPEILIFGTITPYAWEEYGEMDAMTFYKALQEVKGQDLLVRVNTRGGSVWEGVAIYNLLKEHKGKVTVRVEGMAGSIGTVIALGGDEVLIGEASNWFVHEAHLMAYGNADDFREMAAELDKVTEQILGVYVRRTGGDRAELAAWMKEEKLFTGAEAVEAGFCDALFEDEEESPTPTAQKKEAPKKPESREPENKADPKPPKTEPETDPEEVSAEAIEGARASMAKLEEMLG